MAPRLTTCALAALLFGASSVSHAIATSDLDIDADALEEALAADEVCQPGDDSGECGVELRQLRAQQMHAAAVNEHRAAAIAEAKEATKQAQEAEIEKSAEESAGAKQGGRRARRELVADTHFGPDAVGTEMWKETTYEDIMLTDMYVSLNASGTCNPKTTGSCSVFSCDKSRGATKCSFGSCVCLDGYCALQGACYPKPGSCVADTGGTCSITGCKKSRGETKCTSGKCLCKPGGCVWGGKCYPVTATGGTCSLLSCAASRGPTTCQGGSCICKDGYVAVKGVCTPFDSN